MIYRTSLKKILLEFPIVADFRGEGDDTDLVFL